jgi:hypothetical protein
MPKAGAVHPFSIQQPEVRLVDETPSEQLPFPQCSFRLETKLDQKSHGTFVRYQRAGLDPVQAHLFEPVPQYGTQGLGHDPALPMIGMQLIADLGTLEA